MAGKGKKGKGKKGKKGKEEEEPKDEYMEMDGSRLEKTLAMLKEKWTESKVYRNMLQIEKDMIHDFYHNTRTEIKELDAEIKNFDTKMQELEEHHNVEKKVYEQKVKHLDYEHDNSCNRVKNQAQTNMKEENQEHKESEKVMVKEKKDQKDDYARDDLNNIAEIEEKEKDLDANLKEIQF